MRPNTDENNTKIEFEAGQPLIHLFPATEKKLELRRHLVDEIEFRKLSQPRSFFNQNYQKLKKMEERNQKENKCPFGFSDK